MATEGDAMRKYSALLYEQMNTRDDVSVRDAQWLLRPDQRQARVATDAALSVVPDRNR